jgi:4-hydroxybenzoate polyprenyltransferase
MTTPEDVTPDAATPAPKKPAAKKAPAATTAKTNAKPKATSAKPAAKTPAKKAATPPPVEPPSESATPATNAAPLATAQSAPPQSTPAKSTAKSTAKPAAAKVAAQKTPSVKATPTKPAAGKVAPVKTTAAKSTAAKAAPKKAEAAATAQPVKHKPTAPAPIIAPVPTPTAAPVVAAPAISLDLSPAVASTLVEPELPATDRANVHAGKILKRADKKPIKSDFIAKIQQKSAIYWRLTRMDRPIGTLLLLWPTLWSLWIAAKGVPSLKNLVIFVLGVIVMRAAGCVINDFADRKIDGKVQRTKERPLATGEVSSKEAIGLFIALCLTAFTLVLFTDPFTIKLSVGGLVLAFCYPFMKRHTHLPQVVLGAAFAWGIPMAYAAEAGKLPQEVWLIYLAVVLWTVAYDTFYAMVDRDDDLKIGVKSTAILFGEQDRLMTGILQAMTIYALILVGNRFELGAFYYLGLTAAAGLFVYQQWLIRFRARAACFQAFLNNNWVGVVVFAGIVADYALR